MAAGPFPSGPLPPDLIRSIEREAASVTDAKVIIGKILELFNIHCSLMSFSVSCATFHFYYSGMLFLLLRYMIS